MRNELEDKYEWMNRRGMNWRQVRKNEQKRNELEDKYEWMNRRGMNWKKSMNG